MAKAAAFRRARWSEQRIADLERRVSELEFVYRNLARDTTILYGILRMDLDALKRNRRVSVSLTTECAGPAELLTGLAFPARIKCTPSPPSHTPPRPARASLGPRGRSM